MARSKKATGKKPTVVKETALPELTTQTLGSHEAPSRVYGNRIVGNAASEIRYRFNNLWCGITPFQTQQGYISIKDAVWLCQKAYWNVSIFRNAINTLAELCNTEIYLEGGNQQSRDFFDAWFQRINLWKLKDEFFRELFRSGNIFLFRLDGKISKADALKLSQTYGASSSDLTIPLRYIFLNVADMATINSISFDQPQYYKILTPQQVQMLKKSENPDDKEIFKSLPQAIKKYFDGGAVGSPIPIDMSKLHTVFYQKQDYEPFAVPMGFAVLDDINLKLELKKTDAILARTVENITLLVTTGTEPKPDGSGGVSAAAIGRLTELFNKEQVGRVLVADFSTKMDWSIPDLSKVLGPSKYETVNQDISQGLLDIFFGSQRYADVAAKLKVFVEKLDRVQEIFLNDFLQTEIRRVSQLMNFKSYPEAKFVKVSIDDPTQFMRVIAQLTQLGVLTAKDGLDALENGEIPDFETVLENQRDYKEYKDEGLFQPVTGGVTDQLKVLKESGKQEEDLLQVQQEHEADMAKEQQKHEAKNPPPAPPPAIHISAPIKTSKQKQPTGRPPGSKSPQTTKKISPIGTGSEQKFSMAKLIEAVKLQDHVNNALITAYKKKHNLKRLKNSDKSMIEIIGKTLFENESPENWENKVEDYVDQPVPANTEIGSAIGSLAAEYEISYDAATLLYHSKI